MTWYLRELNKRDEKTTHKMQDKHIRFPSSTLFRRYTIMIINWNMAIILSVTKCPVKWGHFRPLYSHVDWRRSKTKLWVPYYNGTKSVSSLYVTALSQIQRITHTIILSFLWSDMKTRPYRNTEKQFTYKSDTSSNPKIK